MPKFEIHHITRYRYDSPVFESANEIRLFPIDDDSQKLNWMNTEITGAPNIHRYQDFYGNTIGVFEIPFAHTEMCISSSFVVETKALERQTACETANWTDISALANELDLIDFIKLEPFEKEKDIQNIIQALSCRLMDPEDAALELMLYVYTNFRYKKGVTSSSSTLMETWTLKAGVCQDFAHVLLYMLRTLGIPSRYVSGYICPNKNGARGTGATHAWVEAYLPGQAWIGLDPTNNCMTSESYIKLCTGRSFADCSPVKGTFKGEAKQTLEVVVSVGYEDGTVIEDILQEDPNCTPEERQKVDLLNIQIQQQQ